MKSKSKKHLILNSRSQTPVRSYQIGQLIAQSYTESFVLKIFIQNWLCYRFPFPVQQNSATAPVALTKQPTISRFFFAKCFFANFVLGDWLKTSSPITCTSILDLKKCTPTTTFCKSSTFARNIKKNRNWQGSLRRLVANQKTKFLFLSKPSGNVTI